MVSSSNKDDLNNAFGNSADDAFPTDLNSDDTAEPNFDSVFGALDDDPFASQSQSDNPFESEAQPGAFTGAADSSSSSSDLPFGDWSASAELSAPDAAPDMPSGFETGELLPDDQPFNTPETGKRARKGKKEKKQKVRKAKEPVKKVPLSLADVLLFLYGLLAFVSVAAVDIGVFMKYQMTAMNFFIAFNALGLCLLLVPFMLFRQSRRGNKPNFYDVMLGLSLTLVIIAVIAILYVQSLKYGMNFKADLKDLPNLPVPTAPAATPATPAATPATPAATPATPATAPATPATAPATPATAPATPAATPTTPATTPATPATTPATPAATPATPATAPNP